VSEKKDISSKYLGPQEKEASGLKDADAQLKPEAVDVLIKDNCRESGVMNLKKHIERYVLVFLLMKVMNGPSFFQRSI
jgi:Lon-like ATP-dependent protease